MGDGAMGAAPPGPVAPSLDPSTLPQGAMMLDDGSVIIPPEFARQLFSNPGAGPVPPPPMGMGGPPMPMGGAPMGPEPTPGAIPGAPPFARGQMPGQPPMPPGDPAGDLMFRMEQERNPPPPGGPAPLPSLPASPGPPPRDEWPLHLQKPGGASKPPTPIDRVRNRGGGGKPPMRRG
jgi:hypothetical protein